MRAARLGWTLVALLLAACGDEQPPAPTAPADAALAPAGGTNPGVFGTITIALDAQPNSPVDVPFATTGKKLPAFTLDDDASDAALPVTRTFTKLIPGTYTVRQMAGAGNTLNAITCTSQPNGGRGTDNNTVDLTSGAVTIQLERAEAVTCTFVMNLPPWHEDDLTTSTQLNWDTSTGYAPLLLLHFADVYASSAGLLEVGIVSQDAYSMSFTSADAVLAYLPAGGPAGPLTGDLANPTSSSSGAFGGGVVALKLDVDFGDAGWLPASSGLRFGDLTLCNFSSQPALNAMSVRQVLGVANTLLSGGSAAFSLEDINALTQHLSATFVGGTPSQFAQDHLVNGRGTCP